MAMVPPVVAASIASWIVVQGAASVPSLVPLNEASTYSTPGPSGRSPKGPAGQGATSWQLVSPGTACCPFGQAVAGRIAAQPPVPSDWKPAPQSRTPIGRQAVSPGTASVP